MGGEEKRSSGMHWAVEISHPRNDALEVASGEFDRMILLIQSYLGMSVQSMCGKNTM